jgi:hypothetical protein
MTSMATNNTGRPYVLASSIPGDILVKCKRGGRRKEIDPSQPGSLPLATGLDDEVEQIPSSADQGAARFSPPPIQKSKGKAKGSKKGKKASEGPPTELFRGPGRLNRHPGRAAGHLVAATMPATFAHDDATNALAAVAATIPLWFLRVLYKGQTNLNSCTSIR